MINLTSEIHHFIIYLRKIDMKLVTKQILIIISLCASTKTSITCGSLMARETEYKNHHAIIK